MAPPDRNGSRSAVARASARFRQFGRHLRDRTAASTDARLRSLLTPEQWWLVARLAAADRRHSLDVHDRLAASGCDDLDVLLAALLHDVGKVDAGGRVGLSQRVVAVLLGWLAPSILERAARPSRWGWRHGLYLARQHPVLGAAAARTCGCSERVHWLIAHHHDATALRDPGLCLLHAADEGG